MDPLPAGLKSSSSPSIRNNLTRPPTHKQLLKYLKVNVEMSAKQPSLKERVSNDPERVGDIMRRLQLTLKLINPVKNIAAIRQAMVNNKPLNDSEKQAFRSLLIQEARNYKAVSKTLAAQVNSIRIQLLRGYRDKPLIQKILSDVRSTKKQVFIERAAHLNAMHRELATTYQNQLITICSLIEEALNDLNPIGMRQNLIELARHKLRRWKPSLNDPRSRQEEPIHRTASSMLHNHIHNLVNEHHTVTNPFRAFLSGRHQRESQIGNNNANLTRTFTNQSLLNHLEFNIEIAKKNSLCDFEPSRSTPPPERIKSIMRRLKLNIALMSPDKNLSLIRSLMLYDHPFESSAELAEFASSIKDQRKIYKREANDIKRTAEYIKAVLPHARPNFLIGARNAISEKKNRWIRALEPRESNYPLEVKIEITPIYKKELITICTLVEQALDESNPLSMRQELIDLALHKLNRSIPHRPLINPFRSNERRTLMGILRPINQDRLPPSRNQGGPSRDLAVASIRLRREALSNLINERETAIHQAIRNAINLIRFRPFATGITIIRTSRDIPVSLENGRAAGTANATIVFISYYETALILNQVAISIFNAILAALNSMAIQFNSQRR